MSPIRFAGSAGTLRTAGTGKLGYAVSGSFVQKWPAPAGTSTPTVTPSAYALKNSAGVAMYAVANAYTQAQMLAWKNAGGTHVLLQMFWDRWQPTQGGAISSSAVAEWRGWVTTARSLGLRVVAELDVAAPPAWFTSAAPRFKNQNGTDFAGNGDTTRDFVFSSVTRAFYADFATKALAQLTSTDLGAIDTWRVGGGPLGELTYPDPHALTADGTGWDFWLGSTAAQSGTNRASTISAPPQVGTYPGASKAPGVAWDSADIALNDWYQNAMVDYMRWWIGLHRTGGWAGVVSVLHASWGLRPTRGTGDSVYRNEAAAGTDWARQMDAYPDSVCAPWCTWANRASDGTADGDLSPARYITKLAAARNLTWGLFAENASGASSAEMDRIFTSTTDGVLSMATPFRGLMWVSYDSLTGGGSGDGTLANITTRINGKPADPSKVLSTATSIAPTTTSAQPRLTLSAGGIVKRSGVAYRTGGVNAFQIIHNDYPSPRLMSHAEIDSLLDKAVTLKAGIIRAHTLGVNIGSTANHLVTGVTGTTTPVISYNAAVWEVMDYAVAAAAQRGLYLMVPMVDELGYYHGGKRQWVNFRRPGTCSTDGNVKSANSATERAAENYFYSDPQIKADFKQYLSDWLNHLNQYTGRAYKDEPAIAIIETGNEMWTADDYRTYTPEIAALIKSVAPNVLVADGIAADGSSYWDSQGGDSIEHIVTTESLNSSAIDIVGLHPYSYFTAASITTAAARAAAKGKAFLVGEYPWSKTTASGIESAARAASNVVATAFWSLQNDADLHNNGAGYGIDDASLYVPGKDSTQTTAVARLQAHSLAMSSGTTTTTPPVTTPVVTSTDTTSDNFTGTNGSAPDSSRWTVYPSTGSSATIQSNALRLLTGNAGGYADKVAVTSKAGARVDQRVTLDFTPASLVEGYFQVSLRSSAKDASIGDVAGYRVEVATLNGGVSVIRRGSNPVAVGSSATIAGWAAGKQVHLDFSVIGSTITVYAWTGTTKPTTPTITATNTDVTTAGYSGIVLNGGNATAPVTVTVDNYTYTNTANGFPSGNLTTANGSWTYLYGTDFDTPVALGSFPGSTYSSRFDGYDGFNDTSKRGTYSVSKTTDVANSALRVDMHSEGSTYYVGAPIVRSVAGTAYSGQVYGRYSTRMRAVTLAGNPTGYKIAFMLWPVDDVWPAHGEYDYPETELSTGSYAGANAHYASSGGGQDQFVVPSTTLIADWHTYTIEWGPGRMEFFCDEVSLGVTTTLISTFPMRWTLQCETDLDVTPTSSMRSRVEVDWVAMWSRTS